MYLVYLHLYEIHKRDFYCFFMTSLSCHRSICNRCHYICGHLFIYLKLTSSIASSIAYILLSRVFFAAGGFHVIFQHPLLRFISSISTLCQIVTLLHSVNVVCPEIRVKGLAPIDSFRFLAFILLLCIAVVNFMPSFHSRGQCT